MKSSVCQLSQKFSYRKVTGTLIPAIQHIHPSLKVEAARHNVKNYGRLLPIHQKYGDSLINLNRNGRLKYCTSAINNINTRFFSTKIDEESWEQPLKEVETQSNRSLFRAMPVNPSILEHIRSIGVGIRAKKKRKKPSKQHKTRDGGILTEADETEFFSGKGGERRTRSKPKDDGEGIGIKASSCMPPPPFSAQVIEDVEDVTEKGHRIKRLPVKVLGRVGSMEDEMPRSSKGLPEVAIVGRSNVGKSTLLNVSHGWMMPRDVQFVAG